MRWPSGPPKAFPPYQQQQRQLYLQTACSVDKGHGRLEKRTLCSSTWLNDYLDWPGVAQVFRIERSRTVGDQQSTEVAYGITSLSRDQADAARLLDLVRGHWEIENRLHHVRDVTLGEDDSRIRKGSAPEVLAAIRNVVLHLLEDVEAPSKAAATRRLCAHPEEAVALLGSED